MRRCRRPREQRGCDADRQPQNALLGHFRPHHERQRQGVAQTDAALHRAPRKVLNQEHRQRVEHRWPQGLSRSSGLQDLQGRHGSDDPMHRSRPRAEGHPGQLRQPRRDRVDRSVPSLGNDPCGVRRVLEAVQEDPPDGEAGKAGRGRQGHRLLGLERRVLHLRPNVGHRRRPKRHLPLRKSLNRSILASLL